MNKYLFIIGFVGTALFTACSTADDLVSEIPSQGLSDEEKAMIVEAGQDSDVPITIGSLGNRRAMTRTSVESDEHDLFITPDDQYLGVYCLATGLQEGAPSIHNVTPESDDGVVWNGAYPYSNWMDNIPAIVSKYSASTGPLSDATEAYSYVSFLDPIDLDDESPTETSKVYYYPFGNWYHYDFFAYYPRQKKADPSDPKGSDAIGTHTSARSSYVVFEIDGTQDIIWGKASGDGKSIVDSSNKTVKAYSSKYLRLMKEVDEDHNGTPDNTEYEVVPAFTFYHLLTQFVFSIKPHDTDASDIFDKGFKVTELSLKDVYKDLRLYVACKPEDTHTMGDLSIISNNVIDIPASKIDDDGSPFPIYVAGNEDNTLLDDNEKEVGYVIVPPSLLISSKTHNQYLVNLKMQQKDEAGRYPGDDGYSGSDVPDTVVQLTPPEGGFSAGHKYNITIEIYNPTNIQATATLADWNDEAETVIGVD